MQFTQFTRACLATLLLALLAFTNGCATAERITEPPAVLIIGDSISIGYTPGVLKHLTDVATVQRIDQNGGSTQRGLTNLDGWLGDTRWDVIHFNWGLHDLCYRHPDATTYGNRDKINGTISVPLNEYKANLEALVVRLKATGADLIWANTTMVPDGEAGRFPNDALKYNLAAEEVMNRHGIEIDDLHALTSRFEPSLFVAPGDVHFTDEGYSVIAKQVAEQISAVLNRQ